jgi:hypothetical protein
MESQIRSLRESVREMPKMIHRQLDAISPPDVKTSLRGEKWVRVKLVKPASGQWHFSTLQFATRIAIGGDGSFFNVKRLRVMLYASSEGGPSELRIGVNNDSATYSASGTSSDTDFYALGSPGSSGAVVEVDLGRAVKQVSVRGGTDLRLATINLATVGGVDADALVVDVLCDVTIDFSLA